MGRLMELLAGFVRCDWCGGKGRSHHGYCSIACRDEHDEARGPGGGW